MKLIESDSLQNLPSGDWTAGRGQASLGTFLWVMKGEMLCALGIITEVKYEAAFWAYHSKRYHNGLLSPKKDTAKATYFERVWQRAEPLQEAAFLYGTVFQRAAWRALLSIPRGQTTTYSAIALAIGNPRAVRAVGTAIGKNPIGLLIPCHRVLGVSGLGGYAWGLPLKQQILAAEGMKCLA